MTHTATGRATAASTVTALRVLAVLTVVVLAWQFVTAGSIVGPGEAEGAESLHATGAIVLHVVSGLTMIVAALVWRAGAPLWPAVVAAVVFVLSFVQAYFGSGATLAIHVPGAMVLTIGAVVVAAWSFTPSAR
ncbi:hypothetical protein EV188_107172 [Actinomycetospora succinea]|uniref:Integral membrane protein n=1 Tax=Actinomycetospora succinea TaxID=663603 RepID=A0A4R6UZI9_9PSEU|nr:hypothetical protein [Actinomycetospora succinea]TDQ52795.1 hypothetical protein EV188_107172 [Actinomycetospora succinea]